MTDIAAVDSPPKTTLCSRSLADLRQTETWIFDLDNTLYPASCRLFDQVEKNMTQFIQNLLSLTRDEAYQIQKTYFHDHGTTMAGLMHHHQVSPQDFLHFVHNIDLNDVPVSEAMNRALEKLPGRKIIFTNGSVRHADNVASHLGIRHHFDDVFDIVAANFVSKPAPHVYEQLCTLHNIDPRKTVMVEDMAVNLRPAADMGMTTVWIRTDSSWGMPDSDGDYIHHVIDDLAQWLAEISGA